jgi:hypothetical protein
MATKIKASELGCGAPYRLTYSGQVSASSEVRALVVDYVCAYRASVEKVVQYFTEVIARGGADELTAYILIGPSNVPPHVGESEAWRAVMGKESDYETLKKGGDLKVIYAIAGYEDQTMVGAYLTKYAKQFGLGIRDLTREKVEALFGLFPRMGARRAVAAAAFQIQRSFLASVENTRKTSQDRQVAFAAAMQRKPAFYEPFYRFCKHLGSWNHGCRFYHQTRQRLRIDGYPQSVINGCQKIVMDRHRDIPAWENTYPVSDEEHEIANQSPNVLALFEERLPSADVVKEDIFRRYGKPGRPIVLAKDTYFIRTVLRLLNDAEALFTTDAEKEAFIHTIKKRGKVTYHHGWHTMCREVEAKKRKADPRFRRAVEFVTGELRDFITSCRAVRTPILKDELVAWPQVPQDRYGWEFVPANEELRGNEVAVSIRLPAFRSLSGVYNRATTVHVTIRGNMPLAKTRLLEEQLDIKNPTKFRPDRLSIRASAFGRETKKTYTKAQALRLILKGTKINAQICSENITEAEKDPNVTKNWSENVKASERVAILHYLPGGCRLGTMAIFEKTADTSSATGWKLITFREQVGTGHQRHIAEKTFLVLEDDELNFVVSNLAKQYQSGDPTENAENMAKAGGIKRHLAETRYKQVAARIARICRDNKVGYLFVAGGGRLISRGGVSHPVNRFFTVSRTVGRTTLAGFLVSATMKSGVTIRSGTAKPAFISSRETVLTGQIPPQLHVVSSFHHIKKQEFGYTPGGIAVSKGKRDRVYDPVTKSTSSFVLNASWSLLLYHFNKEFRASADQVLDSLEEKMLGVNENFEATEKAASGSSLRVFQTG